MKRYYFFPFDKNGINYTSNFQKFIFALCFLVSVGCKKAIEVESPPTSIYSNVVFENDGTAASVLTGIYTNISKDDLTSGGLISMSLFPGLSADELTLFNLSNINYLSYYVNKLTSINPGNFWFKIYQSIFVANSAIEGLSNSTNLTPALKKQLLGEAKFIRAFCYFYLVNLYRDVPLATSTDWSINAGLPRTPETLVFEQIISDLKDAQNLLSADFLKSDAISSYSITSAERVRPNSWAATALLARSFLYTGDYTSAEKHASSIINNITMFNLVSLDDAFKRNSKEAIWQLQPVLMSSGVNANTAEGRVFILPSTGPNTSGYPVFLSKNVVNSFDSGDLRKTSWVKYVVVGNDTFYYPSKYKLGSVNVPTSEYSTVLRLAEQYLIRAEARVQLGNISGALADINAIRARAGLNPTTTSDKSLLLKEILHERQTELFTEWGHRWFDLRRTNSIDSVMSKASLIKGGTWDAKWKLYPIPLSEIQKASQLIQNSGY